MFSLQKNDSTIMYRNLNLFNHNDDLNYNIEVWSLNDNKGIIHLKKNYFMLYNYNRIIRYNCVD